jgi:protease-4
VVLRVNSPGGDALASDVVWREVSLCREKKPFVVSMGDVAASGGYYISCAADTIVAQPSTITGSIGVFGIMFNLQKMFSEKLGVTFDGYKTSPFADLGSMTRPLTEQEKQIIGQWVDNVYVTFTGKVAAGRSMDIAQVDSIAQGRVWSGIDAKNAGLVDVLGGLSTAVAKMAKLDNYRIKEMPELKDPFVKLLEDVSGEAEARWMHTMMGDHYETYKLVHKIKEYHGIQARSFYSLTLN